MANAAPAPAPKKDEKNGNQAPATTGGEGGGEAVLQAVPPTGQVIEIPIDKIFVDDDMNHRGPIHENSSKFQELKSHIATTGLLQPVVVVNIPKKGNFQYQLIGGHRRLAAVKSLGQSVIKAVVMDATDKDPLLDATGRAGLDTTQEELKPHQVALAAIRIRDAYKAANKEILQKDIARRVGRDETTVSNFFRVTDKKKIIPQVIEAFLTGQMPIEEALRYTASDLDKEKQTAIWEKRGSRDATGSDEPKPMNAKQIADMAEKIPHLKQIKVKGLFVDVSEVELEKIMAVVGLILRPKNKDKKPRIKDVFLFSDEGAAGT